MDGNFQPIERAPAYMKVFRAIEEKISDGALKDGAHLPTEAELCAQFGVTRSTVREGLRLLEQTGLIVRGPAKKFFIKRPAASDIAAAASKSPAGPLNLAAGGDKGTTNTGQDGAHRFGAHIFCLPGKRDRGPCKVMIGNGNCGARARR